MKYSVATLIARQALLWASAAALAVPTGVHAQFMLSTNDGQITIAGYTGSGGTVNIPSTTNGLPVTRIGEYAFMECTNLTSVTIPEGVTNIGDGTFLDCASLTAVTIPGSVTNIGRGAFENCTRLRSVYLKGNAPHVEDDVFSGARKATIYHLPNTTGWGTTFGGRPTAIWKLPTNPERARRRVRFRKNANPMQKLPRKNCRKAVCL